jgi:hypothetical protein
MFGLLGVMDRELDIEIDRPEPRFGGAALQQPISS